MKNPFKFHDKLVLRVPRMPFLNQYNVDDVLAFYKSQDAREALYVASPSLYNKLLAFEDGSVTVKKDLERLYSSLTRYYIRMHTRTTPFGLFAGVGTFDWDKTCTESSIVLGDALKRNTKFDMDFLCDLSDYLASINFIKNRLKIHVNSSLSTNKDEFRFIDYKRVNGRRKHQVSSLKYSEYIQKVIESADYKNNALDIANALVELDDEISPDEALQFIHALIDMQLLCTELEYSLTGKEYFYKICEIVQKIDKDHPEINKAKKFIAELKDAIDHLDTNKANTIQDYKRIHDAINEVGIVFKENTLFQIDMGLDLQSSKIDISLQSDILKAIEYLNKFTPLRESEDLKEFKKKFNERFENNEIPLLYLLDVDYGIGYGNGNQKDNNALTNDLYFYGNEEDNVQKVEWSNTLSWKIKKLNEAISKGEFEIDLIKTDIPRKDINWNNLPPSFSVMFRAVNNDDILLDSVGNSSAVNLLARFANESNTLEDTLKEIAKEEQDLNPDVLFAEIVHLSDDRLGNILRRPSFREYEIPYLGQTDVEDDFRITLDDILVTVIGQRVVLKSKKLGKEILPRLGTAHNYSMSSQPIYKFLCDLQFQDLRQGLYFSWGMCSSLSKFLPRVRVGRVIISAASWGLIKADFNPLLKASKENLINELNKFRKKFNIPKEFIYLEFDNELLVNSDNLLSIQAWLDVIKNKDTITLKEQIANQTIVKNNAGEIYNNQFIANLIKTVPTYQDMPTFAVDTLADDNTQNFSIGSEWLYYKIYTGQKCMEDLLTNIISPCTHLMLDKELIDKWFYIRYYDTDHHLRLRFHKSEGINVSEINKLLRTFLNDHLDSGKIWKIQIDTYQREVERYGKNTMELSESLFFYESQQILTYLRSIASSEQSNDRWLWSLKAIDVLLNHMEFTLEEKVDLFTKARSMFLTEFNAQRQQRNLISKKFRTHRPDIDKVLAQDNYQNYIGINDYYQEMRSICQQVLAIERQGQLGLSKVDLCHSYVHMLANRLFTSFHRKKELVLYDFLFRYYKSALVQSQKKKEVKGSLVNS